MMGSRTASFGAGTRVKVKKPGPVPEYSTWDDDQQRTSNSVKRRLQGLFFKGDRRIQAAVVYIANESDRERLKSKKLVKVEVRDPAGACIVILAGTDNLVAA